MASYQILGWFPLPESLDKERDRGAARARLCIKVENVELNCIRWDIDNDSSIEFPASNDTVVGVSLSLHQSLAQESVNLLTSWLQ